jgi:tRNA-specific 2-thiouridylase
VGQRKGLNIGGFAQPLFILHTDTISNTVYVGQGEHHRALYNPCVLVQFKDLHLLNGDKLFSGERVWAQVRYRQTLEQATIWISDWGVIFCFDDPQRAIAEGQFVAFYQKLNESDFRLIGSGAMSWLKL